MIAKAGRVTRACTACSLRANRANATHDDNHCVHVAYGIVSDTCIAVAPLFKDMLSVIARTRRRVAPALHAVILDRCPTRTPVQPKAQFETCRFGVVTPVLANRVAKRIGTATRREGSLGR